MISRDTYRKLKAMNDRFEAARKKFDPKRYERGGSYSPKDNATIAAMAGTRGTTNEEKAQIEDFEWRMFPPSRYFGYYDTAMTKITGFMGNLLGRIVYKGPVVKAWGGKRQNVTVRGTNNVMYSGTCNLTGGTYCRLKRIKGKRFGPGVLANAKKRKKPAAKKRKGPSYEQILDYYASLAPRGRSRRNPVKKAKHFIVVTVSKNTNSFGLRGMILMARDGEAWQVGASHLNVKKPGDLVRVPVSVGPVREASWASLGYEIPNRLQRAPAHVAAEVWG